MTVQGLYYFLLGRPNPIWGLLDFYVFAPLNNTSNKWNSSKFQLREKLGGGNFGITFEGLRLLVSICMRPDTDGCWSVPCLGCVCAAVLTLCCCQAFALGNHAVPTSLQGQIPNVSQEAIGICSSNIHNHTQDEASALNELLPVFFGALHAAWRAIHTAWHAQQ